MQNMLSVTDLWFLPRYYYLKDLSDNAKIIVLLKTKLSSKEDIFSF